MRLSAVQGWDYELMPADGFRDVDKLIAKL